MRIGKSADSIFRSTKPKESDSKKAPAKGKAARDTAPAADRKEWKPVNVVMLNRQAAALDKLAAEMRIKTGAAISRAEIIRALVDALTDSRLDVSECASEDEIRAFVTAKLKR